METEIRRSGKWEEYEKQMMNTNKEAMVDDFELAFAWLKVSGALFVLAECLGILEELV